MLPEEQVKSIIRRLKNPPDAFFTPRMPVRTDSGTEAFLRPISAGPSEQAARDAAWIAEWRNKNRDSFFTWFKADQESVLAWLSDRYGRDDTDIMLMLETPGQEPFAHFGLLNFNFSRLACEFSRGVRGRPLGPAGGMTRAGRVLFRWAHLSLGMKTITAEVFENNTACLAWCRRLGVDLVGRIPLRRVVEADRVKWEKTTGQESIQSEPDAFALKMEWRLETLPYCR